jgi:hypothetical protein
MIPQWYAKLKPRGMSLWKNDAIHTVPKIGTQGTFLLTIPWKLSGLAADANLVGQTACISLKQLRTLLYVCFKIRPYASTGSETPWEPNQRPSCFIHTPWIRQLSATMYLSARIHSKGLILNKSASLDSNKSYCANYSKLSWAQRPWIKTDSSRLESLESCESTVQAACTPGRPFTSSEAGEDVNFFLEAHRER